MQSPKYIVAFSNGTARVYKGPEAVKRMADPGVLIEPDLSAVKGLPPHCWYNDNGSLSADPVPPPVVIAPPPPKKRLFTTPRLLLATILLHVIIHFL